MATDQEARVSAEDGGNDNHKFAWCCGYRETLKYEDVYSGVEPVGGHQMRTS